MSKQAVKDYISQNFDLDHVTVTDFSLFPYGQLVQDKEGQSIVVYWDIIKQKVVWKGHKH